MQKKWLLVIPLVLILFVVCAAIAAVGLTGLSSFRGNWLPDIASRNFSAKESEQHTYDVGGPATLSVDNFAGKVRVEKGADGKIVVDSVKETYGTSQQDAQKNLERVDIITKQDGNALDIRVAWTQSEINWAGKVDFIIRVPEETQVTVRSDTGDVYLSGTDGAADLRTDFGSVDVADVQGGALTVNTQNGAVNVKGVRAGSSDIALHSDFGDVTLSDAAGGALTVGSSNGALLLREVQASGAANLSSDFGQIRFEGGSAASLEVNTQNGDITLSSLAVTEKLQASSDFGALSASGCQAKAYILTTLNGEITVDGAAGRVQASTDYGEMAITNASTATLDLTTKNGAITFEGSLGRGPHSLQSEFGDVVLRLPADQALSVDLKTDFGTITSDFSVTMKGTLDPNHWAGAINGGGDLLTAATNNGKVTLETAP